MMCANKLSKRPLPAAGPGARRWVWPALAALLLMAACAVQLPGSEQQALATWGAPSARHPLPSGAQRLEYATGPMGRSTWMFDLDAQGRVVRAQQVLTYSHLAAVQQALPMPAAALRARIGRPGEVQGGGWAGGQVWSWRYETNECLWFRVSVDDAGVAHSAAFMIDPRCDAPSDARP